MQMANFCIIYQLCLPLAGVLGKHTKPQAINRAIKISATMRAQKLLAVSMNCLTSVHACTVNAVRNRRRTRFLTFQEYFSSTETQPMSVLQNICLKLTVLLLNMECSSSPHPAVDTNRRLHLLGLKQSTERLNK